MQLEGAEEYANILWIDVESSGLHAGSFPIEVGWCSVDLSSTSFLIRPLPTWSVSEWSPSAERLHGIDYDTLIECGADAADVAHWLNAACQNRTIFSDNPSYDNRWIARLFDDVNVPCEFQIFDAAHAAGIAAGNAGLSQPEADAILARVHARYPHPHRAGPDCRRTAAEFLSLALPHRLSEIEGMA